MKLVKLSKKQLIYLVYLLIFFITVLLAQQKLKPKKVKAQAGVPLEWTSLAIGTGQAYYDAAVTMHINTIYICVDAPGNPSSWEAAYQPVISRDLKAIVMPGCLKFNSGLWSVLAIEVNIKPFLNWLRDNPDYKNATQAILLIDEPYWTNGNDTDGDGCPGYHHDNLALLYNLIHTESGGVPVHYSMGSDGPLFWYNQNLTGSANLCYKGRTGIDGIADYQAGYVSNGADSSYNQQEVIDFIANNKAVTDEVGTKLAIVIRTWTRSTFNMTEEMIYNLTCDILKTRQVSALIYYPFVHVCCGYIDYLSNHPNLWDDIAAAIDQCSPPSFSLSPGWNQITWPDVSGYTASSALADIDSDCGAGTAVAIARKRQDWWEEYLKDYGGKNFDLQNNQNYFIKVSKGCSWVL